MCSDATTTEKDGRSMDGALSADPAVERSEQEMDASVDSGVSVVDDSESHDETVSNEGEQNEEMDSDFEHTFNRYFDGNALQIQKEDHFVVVDKVEVEHGDEWLLI